MPRLRRLDAKLLGFGSPTGTDEVPVSDMPLDTEEQEELLQRFELINYSKNKKNVNVLSLLYLLCGGIFLIMATKTKSRSVSSILLAGFQSIICSCVTLRYNLMNDVSILKKLKFKVSNRTVDILNGIILILILWVSTSHFEGSRSLQFLFQIPLLLFIVAQMTKKWTLELEKDISSLRQLKYKYKNV
ncbi:hypothetical protein KAFR_0F03490 [Kazachstania africana CBS 2517]|uniref:Uncharacterized protein n=1 Tax=Kazachstania africana (strain ATCC 22294 / BCRC 22015 / CBS 2517 / CECT 1963 / NBRC 1671 / NRRL Y-8276) TaxID=1071382 RepID=H2AX45_KAZAF|nr:hypothetical protein KAFR_0F03490 [Kazachstania africana CBS 2517]CCF58945.1 hypothetical protein KAFR_0F03490 [Kazachstania africana CBS 2517]